MPSTHIIFGAIISALLLLFFPLIGIMGCVIIFLSSVLIDVDHYLYYAIKKKDWSLRNAYNWFLSKRDIFLRASKKERAKMERLILVLHGIECLAIFALLILVHKIFVFVLIGFVIHLLLDLILPMGTLTAQIQSGRGI